ncbi:hypothetical protein [Amycolatopsis sp. NBC_01480]|uniref:hypothetical protein n=1 Tax=Amycolatopsis sp. NBC_01480 TaxID=2903562 RepID=UPI002E2D7C28|nr:hypothetical protein [Amycolatopsis sp. NBC_01480]
MTDAAWHSQAFPPEGASAAEGIRNQLGRPELDLLTILVRESAQNSWDARLGDRPVDYHLDLKGVSPAHAPAWRELLSRDIPDRSQLPLRSSLSAAAIRILTVSDRGTTGLGGPTRADNAVVANHDFVSFIRNIGEPRDTDLGGGTYGFGKGIFYLLSRPGTVLVHTRCRVEGGFETRLMGCALWRSYAVGNGLSGRRFTGRHWWGTLSSDNVVEPLVGAEADAVAERLGLRPYLDDETGTTVVVIDPELDERSVVEAGTYLADSIAWNLWPKMLSRTPGEPQPMRFSVHCDGVVVPVPDPRETSPLDMFVTAYEELGSETGGRELSCGKPVAKLGNLGLESSYLVPFEKTAAGSAAGIETTVHHVCLMRTAELVVTYHEGLKPPIENFSYAGVFRATAELDSTFASSEPPTHDAWNWHSLDGRDKTFVKMTFARIKDAIDTLLDRDGQARSGSAVPLGAASRVFSNLVSGSWGTGGASDYRSALKPTAPTHESPPNRLSGDLFAPSDDAGAGAPDASGASAASPRPGQDSSTRRPRVEYVDAPYYDVRAGQLVLIQAFQLTTSGNHRCAADLGVTLAGTSSRETDPPRNAAKPHFFGWESPDGTFHTDESPLIEGGDGVWRLLVLPAPDTMTEISVSAMREVQPR